jgi:uncharacterized membrane protein
MCRCTRPIISGRSSRSSRALWKGWKRSASSTSGGSIGGRVEEWDAVITEQHPDERIAWKNTTGATNAGVVTFHRLADNKTRIMLQMEYDPQGVVENLGDMLGMVSRRVANDLERFKGFIEARGHETGAWRGEVERPGQ